MVLEDLPDQLAALEGRPHHTETGGVDHDPPELEQQLQLQGRKHKVHLIYAHLTEPSEAWKEEIKFSRQRQDADSKTDQKHFVA